MLALDFFAFKPIEKIIKKFLKNFKKPIDI